MPITINVNGLNLCHRGSGGVSHNTLPDVCMREMGLRSARANGGMYDVRIPDVVIMRNPRVPDLTAGNLKAVVEIKFNNQPRNHGQILDYERIAGGAKNKVAELSPQACRCAQPQEERVAALEKERGIVREPEPDLLQRYSDAVYDSTGVRLAGAALAAYGALSLLTRLYPPRNLVPAP